MRHNTPQHLSSSDYGSEQAREARQFYRDVLIALESGGVPVLVGGAYAHARYTGIKRPTKDFDIFVRPRDFPRTLDVLATAGLHTEASFPHWLGKAGRGDNVVDIIFNSGNGMVPVDDEWFAHAVPGEVFALPVLLCPPEEMLWSKSFVMERERFDGADVMHLLQARGEHLDWPRLLSRFGANWRVLLSSLVLYNFIYPGEPCPAPRWIYDDLLGRLRAELDVTATLERVCRGTLLSREQYLADVLERGYADARQQPLGNMTADQIANWTRAIEVRDD